MGLAKKIREIWREENIDFEKSLEKWVTTFNSGGELAALAKREFHQWGPLRTYISVSTSRSSSKAIFSLRFYGQEVAQLTVKDKTVMLELKGHERKNDKWFGVKTKDGIYDWRGKEAGKFRAYFKELAQTEKGFPRVDTPEHRIATKFTKEMRKGYGKFGIMELQIQPVLIADKFPFQVPLPISASSGEPKKGNGHIDILARRMSEDNKVRLSVFELKRPGEYKYAASQAYIYAYTLLHVLRESRSNTEWYRLFGFESSIPKGLVIEAVVAITKDQNNKFMKEEAELKRNEPFVFGNDRIELCVAYYNEKADSIEFEENPFNKNS